MFRHKFKKIFLIIFLITFLGTLGIFSISYAQNTGVDVGLEQVSNSGLGNNDIRDTIANIIRIILGFLGTLAVILFMYGGFLYMFARGNAEQVDKAKKLMVQTVTGLLIVLSSYGITTFVINQLTDATGSSGSGSSSGINTGNGGGGNNTTPCVGAGCEGGAFMVQSITPQGQIDILNAKVKILFNNNVKASSVPGNILVKNVNTDEYVEGTMTLDGARIEFTPNQLCEGSEDRNCFDKDTKYQVWVRNGTSGIRSSNQVESLNVDIKDSDNAELIVLGDNLINDADMEDSNTFDWINTKANSEKFFDNVHDGLRSLQVTSFAQRGGVFQTINDLDSDHKYEIKFWYNITQPTYLKLSKDSINDEGDRVYLEDGLISDGQWNEFKTVINIEDGSDTLALSIYAQESDSTFYLDDVSVHKMGKPVSNAGSANGQALTCKVLGGQDHCRGEFITGNVVDVIAPKTYIFEPFNGAGIPLDEDGILVQFSIKDDAFNHNDYLGGISHSQLFIRGENDDGYRALDAIYTHGITPSPADIPDAAIILPTDDLELQGIYFLRVRSWDIDSNFADSNEVGIIIRPDHCYDAVLDSEQGEILPGPPACGGPCGACSGSICENDFDCPDGACINNACLDIPKIIDIEPKDGGPGSFVTLKGIGFGDKKGSGKVIFGLDTGMEVEALYPTAPCQATWTDEEVTVIVPPNAISGAIKITNDEQTRGGLWDTTADNRGWEGEFEVNDLLRPGLCVVNPETEEPFKQIVLRGQNFGSTPQTNDESFVKFGAQIAQVGFWDDKVLSDVVIPSMDSGDTMVSVTRNGLKSNSLNFVVKQSSLLPQINMLDPNFGPVGQYITIFGMNFGHIPGTVLFKGSDGTVKNADIDFPAECNSDYWHEDYIIVKVPKVPITDQFGESIDYQILVRTSEFKESNLVDFNVNRAALKPGICRIEPNFGPIDTKVKMYGERFGGSEGKVEYFDKKVINSDLFIAGGEDYTWSNDLVTSLVPAGTETGNVVLISELDNNGNGIYSNRLKFTIGSCQANDECQPGVDCCDAGLICCADGSCSSNCDDATPFCHYSWQFSTGLGGPGFPCTADEQCNCPEDPQPDDPCLVCLENECTESCTADGDCVEGQTCFCPEAFENDDTAGKYYCYCKDYHPRVLERANCDEGELQSPSPFLNTLDACTNSKIVVLFTVDMDETMFRHGNYLDSDNIIIKECNVETGIGFEKNKCNNDLIRGSLNIINQGLESEEGFEISPYGGLKDNTWYEVTIKGGDDVGVRSQPNLVNPEGLSMIEDYTFQFRAKSDCQPEFLTIAPQNYTFSEIYQNRIFTGEIVANNCNMLTGLDYLWSWRELSNIDGSGFPYILGNTHRVWEEQRDENGNIVRENNEPVFVENEKTHQRYIIPVQNTPNDNPAQTQANYDYLTDKSDITVRMIDETVPRVIIDQTCNYSTQSPSPFLNSTDVCTNALVSARFTHDMHDESINKDNIKVFECGVTEYSESECVREIEPREINVIGDDKPGEGFIFIPNLNQLSKNHWYRVVITGGENGVKSVDGISIRGNRDGNFEYTFKTKNTNTPCNIARVQINPEHALLEKVGETIEYNGLPIAGNCQILFGDYVWEWNKLPNEDDRAELLDVSDNNNINIITGRELINNYNFGVIEVYQCSDNRDNDGDGLRDKDDPDCHYDNDASNYNSYIPEHNNESAKPTKQRSDWFKQANYLGNALFEVVDSTGKIDERSMALVKLPGQYDDGFYQEFSVRKEGNYQLNIEYLVKNDSAMELLVKDGNSLVNLITPVKLDSKEWQTKKIDFKVNTDHTDRIRVYIQGEANQEIDGLVNYVSVKEQIDARGRKLAKALKQTLPAGPVIISGEIPSEGKSGTAELTIVLAKPKIIKEWPLCESACLNTSVGGQFNIEMDHDSLNYNPAEDQLSKAITLNKCSDETCISYEDVTGHVVADDSAVNDKEGTTFTITSNAENLLLDPNAWYRVIVNGGALGAKSKDGIFLSILNYDAVGGDSINDSYSWIFKTKDSICQIDKIDVKPNQKTVYWLDYIIDYSAEGIAVPDVCDPYGQKINPFTLDWRWLSTVENVARITDSDGNLIDKYSIFGFADPYQKAYTQTQGKTNIQASIMDQDGSAIMGEGELEIVCGFANDLDCPIPDDELVENNWGINELNSCCYERPHVILRESSTALRGNNTVTISAGSEYKDSEGLSPDDGESSVCRNAVITASFDKAMIEDTFIENVTLKYFNGKNWCPGEEIVDEQPGVNQWCNEPFDISVVNYRNSLATMMLKTEYLMKTNRTYQVNINGGYLDNNMFVNGVKSTNNIAMNGDFSWEFTVGEQVCTISDVVVHVARGDSQLNDVRALQTDNDFFGCKGGFNGCSDDILPNDTFVDNQHLYIPIAYDKNERPLSASYSWVNTDKEIIDLCWNNPDGDCPNYESADFGYEGVSIGTPNSNGRTVLSVFAEGDHEEAGTGVGTMDVTVFLCERPWPNPSDYPWRDTADHIPPGELTNPNPTNFSFFYCMDYGDPNTIADDLPPLIEVAPRVPFDENENIVIDDACPSTAAYVCAEDVDGEIKTYNNECVAERHQAFIIKPGRCKAKLIKEYLFFVDEMRKLY